MGLFPAIWNSTVEKWSKRAAGSSGTSRQGTHGSWNIEIYVTLIIVHNSTFQAKQQIWKGWKLSRDYKQRENSWSKTSRLLAKIKGAENALPRKKDGVGLVPNCGLVVKTSERRGREIEVPKSKGTQRVQSPWERSFQVNGANIFNSLPKSIRNFKSASVDEFKSKLDGYLETLPDEPKLSTYIPTGCNQFSARPSTTIVDQARTRLGRPGQWMGINQCIQSIDWNNGLFLDKTLVPNKINK